MKNLSKFHKVWSIIEEEEHSNFKPLMAYTRTSKLREWMEQCERSFLSILIHSLRQHATRMLSLYGSKNGTVFERWRQQDASQWMTEHKIWSLVLEDYTILFHLIENVLGFEEAENFLEVPEHLRNEFMYTARSEESGKKDLDRAETVFKRMREVGLFLKPSPFSSMTSHSVKNRVKVDEILTEKRMYDEFVKLWADQKETANLHKILTMYRHETSKIITQICVVISRGKILVNHVTRFAKLTVTAKDEYKVTMKIQRKVLLERSKVFMEKMSCREEKGVSHMVEISECDQVEIYVKNVVLTYYNDLKKKLVDENVMEILSLLQISVAISFNEGVMSCEENLEADPWSEDEEDIGVSCLDELHLPEEEVTLSLQRDSSEPTRAKIDDVFLKLHSGALHEKDDEARREMKVLIFNLHKKEADHEVSTDTLYGKDYDALIGEITREADNMPWMMDKPIMKKYNKDISKDHQALGKLRCECKCKRALSNQHQVQVEIGSQDNVTDFSELLTKARFEELNMDLFKKTMEPVKKVLKIGELKNYDIDEIVLDRERARIPKVQEMLKDFFNDKERNEGTNSDEALSCGAYRFPFLLSSTLLHFMAMVVATENDDTSLNNPLSPVEEKILSKSVKKEQLRQQRYEAKKAEKEQEESKEMVKKAIEVLDEIYEPDEYVFACRLDELCENGSDVASFSEDMRSRFKPNHTYFASLLYGWCIEGKMMKAKHVLVQMKEVGFEPDVVDYTNLLSGYAHAGKIADVYVVLKGMRRRGFEPNANCYAMIQALCKVDRMEEAMSVSVEIERMKQIGYYLDHDIYNVVIRLTCKLGEVKEAVRLWNKLEANDLRPEVDMFVIMINGLTSQGCLIKACDYFKEKKLEMAEDIWCCITSIGTCELNVTSWTIWIHALFSKGYVKEACSCCVEMIEMDFMLQPNTYSKLVKGLKKLHILNSRWRLRRR
ncbi:unnamed protein product [Eruca vesicaria subsp. sativa]|uniref:At3g05675-like ankyrin-like domain-containing protein n=1 Tax=Eruca vesicaria subsp. sativa TaxID=29727 RepID=A0ABC8JG18_ERUVS|nr:unnamed protein product [Eruca vesicaria subsp. sativa]